MPGSERVEEDRLVHSLLTEFRLVPINHQRSSVSRNAPYPEYYLRTMYIRGDISFNSEAKDQGHYHNHSEISENHSQMGAQLRVRGL